MKINLEELLFVALPSAILKNLRLQEK